jgi:hypothetical protein
MKPSPPADKGNVPSWLKGGSLFADTAALFSAESSWVRSPCPSLAPLTNVTWPRDSAKKPLGPFLLRRILENAKIISSKRLEVFRSIL